MQQQQLQMENNHLQIDEHENEEQENVDPNEQIVNVVNE